MPTAWTAESVSLTPDTLTVELSDGRSLSVPLEWFPRLIHATPSGTKTLEVDRARTWHSLGSARRGYQRRWTLGRQALKRKPGFLSEVAHLPPGYPIEENGFPLQYSPELATTPSSPKPDECIALPTDLNDWLNGMHKIGLDANFSFIRDSPLEYKRSWRAGLLGLLVATSDQGRTAPL